MDGAGRSLLHLAILRADSPACLFLLRHGVQLNLQTQDAVRDSALHLLARAPAASAGLAEVAEAILGGGGDTKTGAASAADINLQNAAGETPLIVAVQLRNEPMLQLLLAHGANLELVSLAGKPALWYALQQEEGEEGAEFPAAARLVSAGADVSAAANATTGDTLLHALAREGREAATLFLLSAGAVAVDRANRRGETVLHLAAEGGLATLATALLVAGADPNLQTGRGAAADEGGVWRQTALHLALEHKQEAVVSCLLEFSHQPGGENGFSTGRPLDINLKNSEDETPLGLALGRAGLPHLAAAMLAAGADVDVRNAAGLTLLQQAIAEGKTDAALFLLQHRADINMRTPQGLTPLELAVRNRSEEVTPEPVFVDVYGAQESIPPANVAWRPGTTNRVVVPARQAGNRFLGSLKGLQILYRLW
jgi:ankyrin repeat protein